MRSENVRVSFGEGWSEAPLKKIEKTTLKDHVYWELKRALMSGRFVPGDVLTLKALAEAYGTSIVPVRDALQRLVAERALNSMPRTRSAQIPQMSREEFAKITAIRMRLEGLAAELAAGYSSSGEVAALRTINGKLQRAIKRGHAPAALEFNMSFHFRVYEMARSQLLFDMIESLWMRIGPLLVLPYREMLGEDALDSSSFDGGISCHEKVILALENHDAKAAADGLVADIQTAATWYHDNYQFHLDSEAAEPV